MNNIKDKTMVIWGKRKCGGRRGGLFIYFPSYCSQGKYPDNRMPFRLGTQRF